MAAKQPKLHRSRTDKIIAGVCGGVAETYDIDPTLVRVIFIILAFWGGVGIILYLLGIIFMPYPGEESRVDAKEIGDRIEKVANDIRENLEKRPRRHYRGGEIFAVIIILLGILLLLRNLFPWMGAHLFWPIILILIGVLILTAGRKEKQ